MRDNTIKILKGFLIAAVIIAGIVVYVTREGRNPRAEVNVYTSIDKPLASRIFRAFEKQTGVLVRAVYDSEQTKALGLVSMLLAESSSPQADVFWSGDPAHCLLLVKRGIVQPYISPAAADIPSEFKAPDGTWTGLAARARVLLVNKKVLASAQMPSSILDLADPRWIGQTAMGNPMFGTVSFHIAALFAVWGDEKTRRYLNDLKANRVRIARSQAEVRELVLGGEVAFGLLDTDDASEAMREQAPMAVVYPDQHDMGTLVVPSTVALIRGGPNTEQGKELIDFLLSEKTEREVVESGAYTPLRTGIPLPAGVRSIHDFRRMTVDYHKVADVMDKEMAPAQPWLKDWVDR